ncbi:DUF222 domain-containing protein [Nocardia sp. NBC_00511]|uniref:HNH endonuclease signature motif containing protein n=1 Tax=Nocardia sp. NBC_00511 TaxID=2903591 RepID=UPI0030E5DCDB
MNETAADSLSATELVARLRAVHSTIAVAQAEEVALMTALYRMRREQQLERGVRAVYAGEDAATEIGVALHVQQRTADNLIALGLGLEHRLPCTRAAFEGGRIDLPRVRALHEVFRNIDPELVAALEPRIVAYAENADPARVKRTLRRWLLETDPAGQAERRKTAEADRYVNVTAADNGTAILDAVLPAADGVALYERLREMAQTHCCAADPRTSNQRRADALIALTTGTGRLSCGCGHRDCPRAGSAVASARKVLVQVGLSAETLAGLADNPALLAGFGAIDADLARQLARHARFEIIPEHPARIDHSGQAAVDGQARRTDTSHTTRAAVDSRTCPAGADHSGQAVVDGQACPMDTGRTGQTTPETGVLPAVAAPTGTDDPAYPAAACETRYRPGTRLAHRIRALDGGCRAPGCAIPAAATDIDHQDRFDHRSPESGGRTVESNLGCRCRRHHRTKTLADNGLNGWQVIHHPDRRVEWRSPSGGSITTTPEGAKFLFPRTPVPPVTGTGLPESEQVEPLLNPGGAVNELTELLHVYQPPAQRRHAQAALSARAARSACEPRAARGSWAVEQPSTVDSPPRYTDPAPF